MFESLDEIRTFVRVVDVKSLSAAARGLRVSVNAVWRRLERIEERAGVRLIERTTSLVVLMRFLMRWASSKTSTSAPSSLWMRSRSRVTSS